MESLGQKDQLVQRSRGSGDGRRGGPGAAGRAGCSQEQARLYTEGGVSGGGGQAWALEGSQAGLVRGPGIRMSKMVVGFSKGRGCAWRGGTGVVDLGREAVCPSS